MKILGAKDPDLMTLLQDKFYKSYLDGEKGFSKLKAILRYEKNLNQVAPNGHLLLQLIIQCNLEKKIKIQFIKLLLAQGANANLAGKNRKTSFQTALDSNDEEIISIFR